MVKAQSIISFVEFLIVCGWRGNNGAQSQLPSSLLMVGTKVYKIWVVIVLFAGTA